ncbi:hypothetical protein POPTR_004G105800v4 [Populus trichocarpa]|uniref:Uncharacterized protein n=1 Tax=Populus trichocarpa TaxID=3694 RepID=A0ACC0T4A5_POPTR|nr:hypothetical protein BDE02_04G091900 [Populus trichocarpa]KAI9396287.1 hypothetical protein POPTR_004G105800v4 [Populus trichocarpa]
MVMMGLESSSPSPNEKIRAPEKLNLCVGFSLDSIIYDKIDKSENIRVEIRSRKAKKLIEETLKIADSPRTKTYSFSVLLLVVIIISNV